MYGGDLPTAVGQSAERMIPDDADRRRFYRLAPPLLPRLLSARGWRSSAIGNNFFLLAYPAIGLDLGFEEVDDVRHPVLDTPAITRATIRFLEENRDRPFLLHVHYDAPHWPYTPPPAYLDGAHRKALAAWQGDAGIRRDPLFTRYLAEAAYADDALGQVLGALDRLGLREWTLVVVVGDHGEVFDPAHDQTVTALGQPTLHHHGWSGYDELLRVPLVVGLPGRIAPVRVAAPVRLLDLAATIADYLGVDVKLPARGRSLRPLVEGRESEERVAFVEGQDVRAVRAGGLAYLRRDDGRLVVRGRKVVVDEELYDVRADPDEHHDLAAAHPDLLARMRALFRREAPVAPEAPETVYHLRLAPAERPHVLEATLGSDGRIGVRGVRAGAVHPLDGAGLRVEVRTGGAVDFAVDPPDAPLRLALRLDGVPLPLDRVLAGEFAIPVLDAREGRIAGELLDRLDARLPPAPGDRGDVLLYRDPGAAASEPPAAASSSEAAEVRGMMERWGYAQPAPAK
jgi:hypothetical protein